MSRRRAKVTAPGRRAAGDGVERIPRLDRPTGPTASNTHSRSSSGTTRGSTTTSSTIEDRRADYLVRTVGFLIDEGPGVVSVAQELLPDGEGFRAVTHIPAAVVERIVRIGPRP